MGTKLGTFDPVSVTELLERLTSFTHNRRHPEKDQMEDYSDSVNQ